MSFLLRHSIQRMSAVVILVAPLHAIDPAAGHMVEALPERDFGQEVYAKHCRHCHAANRRGVPTAPLDTPAVRQTDVKTLIAKLRQGCAANPESPYKHLEMWQLVKVARHLQKEP